MIVETKCQLCKSRISFWTLSEDRIKLAMDKGEFLELTCKSCQMTVKYHVNALCAEKNKYKMLIGFLLFIIGTPLLGYYTYDYLFRINSVYATESVVGILAIPVAVYTRVKHNDRLKRNAFNWPKLNEYN